MSLTSQRRPALMLLCGGLSALGIALVLAVAAPLTQDPTLVSAAVPSFELAVKLGISTSTAAVAIDIIDGASWIGTVLSIALAASGVGLIGAGTFAIVKGLIKSKGKRVAAGW